MNRSINTLILAAGLTISSHLAPAQAKTDTITFGIVPQQSASRLAKMWSPLLTHLGRENGVQIEFRTTNDIPSFEACLAIGAFDVAYMNPMHYVLFSETAGYTAIVKQSDKKLRGLVVVRSDSNIEAISDLDGGEIAFPSPGAFGASIVPRAEILAENVEFTPRYVKSHDSVYRAVAAGIVPAGGGVLRTFNSADEELKSQLKVIYETGGYTPHAIAGLQDLPQDFLDSFQQAFLSLNESHPELATGVGMNGFEAAADTDWDDVRGLSLTTDQIGIDQASADACPFD